MLPLLLALLPDAAGATLTTCGEAPTTGCYPTIQEAVDAAVDGDLVELPNGTYNERVRIDGKQLSLVGESTLGVRLRGDLGTEPVIEVTGGADVSIEAILVASPVQQAVRVDGATLALAEAVLLGDAVQVAGGVLEARGSTISLDGVSIGGGVAVYGGNVAVFDSTLTASAVELREGHALVDGGGLYIGGSSTVTVTGGSLLDGNRADENGGAIGVEADNTAVTLVLDGVGIYGNSAPVQGGGIAARQADLTVRLAVIADNEAGNGGGLDASGPVAIDRSKLCRNRVTGSGGGADIDSTQVSVLNSWFLENEALESSALNLAGSSGSVTLAFTHVVDNASEGGSAVQLPPSGTITFAGMLVAHNRGETLPADLAVAVPVLTSGELIAEANLYWDNASERLADALEASAVLGDPLLRDVGDGQCSGIPGGITPASAARDSGPSSVSDPDGTRSDIGAAGGPGALLTWWLDRDQDGWYAVYDCNDGAAAMNPDAVDIPYDGLDTNCDLANDFDADGDGHVSDDWDGDDCDDADDTIHPGATDVATDEIDQDCSGDFERDGDQDGYNNALHGGNDCDDNNATVHPGATDQNPYRDMDCDGVRDIEAPVSAVECSTTPARGLWWLALVPLLSARRRGTRANRGRMP